MRRGRPRRLPGHRQQTSLPPEMASNFGCQRPRVDRMDRRRPPALDPGFHTHPVTSNLASANKSAHHGRGEGSRGKSADNGLNSFVVKILTSKPSAIKILQTLFARPAPSKPFKGMGVGDTSKVD